jgi:hypothetical protein
MQGLGCRGEEGCDGLVRRASTPCGERVVFFEAPILRQCRQTRCAVENPLGRGRQGFQQVGRPWRCRVAGMELEGYDAPPGYVVVLAHAGAAM